jgi:hypothetical protein
MKQCEWGWCRHLKAEGHQKKTGGTVLKLEGTGPIRVFWENETVCVFLCEACWRVSSPLQQIH